MGSTAAVGRLEQFHLEPERNVGHAAQRPDAARPRFEKRTEPAGAPPANIEEIFDAVPLAASIAPEVTQSIAAIVTRAQAARYFLDHRPPALDEVRQVLDCIVSDAYRASDLIYRIRALLKEAPPRLETKSSVSAEAPRQTA
jgi:hypothetical protein